MTSSSTMSRRLVRVVAGLLAAVVPSVVFLSDPPLWWNRAHLLWNSVFPTHTEAVLASPVPPGAVVVALSPTDKTTAVFAIDVRSREVLRQLTPRDSGAGAPTISGDRRTIYYADPSGVVRAVDSEGGGGRIVFRPDGSCPLVRRVSVSAADPAHLLLHCRDRLSAHATDFNDFFELIDMEGTVVRRLPTTSSKMDDPTLSPDGRYLAYWGSSETDVEGYPGGVIYVLDLVGDNEPWQLTMAGSSRDTDPAWSDDSTRLAFTREEDGVKSVFTVRRSGGRPERLVDDAERSTWSTDGRSLVAVRRRPDHKVELISFDRHGHHVKRLTGPERTIYAPVWSSR